MVFNYFLFLIACFSLLQCAGQPHESPIPVSMQRQWMLVSMGEFEKEALIKAKATLDLTAYSGRMAELGCGRMPIQFYENGKGQSHFVIKSANEEKCEFGVMNDVFRQHLSRVNRYQIDGHFLLLYHNTDLLMRWVAADWD